jgi:hypothetical protein
MAVYFLILIGFFVVSALSTWALEHYFKGTIAKHIIGVGIIGSMLYDGYLILFVPYQGFQDIVRLLTLYALVAGLVGYGGALLWLNRKSAP